MPLGLNLLLMSGEHVLWRDIADGVALRNPAPNAVHLRAKAACQGGCTPLLSDLCQRSILPFVGMAKKRMDWEFWYSLDIVGVMNRTVCPSFRDRCTACTRELRQIYCSENK
jgi:hypothetical protein